MFLSSLSFSSLPFPPLPFPSFFSLSHQYTQFFKNLSADHRRDTWVFESSLKHPQKVMAWSHTVSHSQRIQVWIARIFALPVSTGGVRGSRHFYSCPASGAQTIIAFLGLKFRKDIFITPFPHCQGLFFSLSLWLSFWVTVILCLTPRILQASSSTPKLQGFWRKRHYRDFFIWIRALQMVPKMVLINFSHWAGEAGFRKAECIIL